MKKNIFAVLGVLLAIPLATAANTATFYYGATCPHCLSVEQYMDGTDLDIEIEQKEVYYNEENKTEFNELCGDDCYVPFLHTQDGDFVGSDVIIDYLGQFAYIFPDVLTGHPNREAINSLYDMKVINGYPDGTFKPENTVNRAELLKILLEGKGETIADDVYKTCFPDVLSEWFAKYVCYANAIGWVDGYPDGTFKPAQTVNKAEALKMLLKSQGIGTDDDVATAPYSDVPTYEWYAPYVSKAKDLGILEENGSYFSPGDGMKRAGIAENLYRLLSTSK